MVTCLQCLGTGLLSPTELCPICEGSGETLVEKSFTENMDNEETKGSPENPFTREEMVEKMGEDAVAKIEAEATPVEAPVEAPVTEAPVEAPAEEVAPAVTE